MYRDFHEFYRVDEMVAETHLYESARTAVAFDRIIRNHNIDTFGYYQTLPNCRVRVQKPIPEFFNDWCQHGSGHHSTLGMGDFPAEIAAFSEEMGFDYVRI